MSFAITSGHIDMQFIICHVSLTNSFLLCSLTYLPGPHAKTRQCRDTIMHIFVLCDSIGQEKVSVHTNTKLPLLNITFTCSRPRNTKICFFVCETDICNNTSTQNSIIKPTVTVSFDTRKMDFLFHGIFSDCTSYALHYREQLCCKNIVILPFIAILWNSAKGKENAFSVDHQDSIALWENK